MFSKSRTVAGGVILLGLVIGLSAHVVPPQYDEDYFFILETCTSGGYITLTTSEPGLLEYDYGCEGSLCSGEKMCLEPGCSGTLTQNPYQAGWYEVAMIWTDVQDMEVDIQDAGCN